MPSMSPEKLFRIKKELETIKEDQIRAEEQLKLALINLDDIGYDTLEEAEKGLEELDKRIAQLTEKVQEEYDEFMEEYGELFTH